jgi:hypothetical protein
VTRLRVGWSGAYIPVRLRDFPLLQNVQTASWDNPASYSRGSAGLSRGWSGWNMISTLFRLVPNLRMGGAIPLLWRGTTLPSSEAGKMHFCAADNWTCREVRWVGQNLRGSCLFLVCRNTGRLSFGNISQCHAGDCSFSDSVSYTTWLFAQVYISTLVSQISHLKTLRLCSWYWYQSETYGWNVWFCASVPFCFFADIVLFWI